VQPLLIVRALAGTLTAALLVTACGDGGSDPVEPTGHAKDNYLAYRSLPVGADPHEAGGLVLVQAQDPSVRITLAEDGVSDVAALYLGEAGEGTVENLRGHTLMYVQDGYWWKVSLRQSGSQVPVLASSTPVADVCLSALIARQPTSPVGAFLLYYAAGTDAECFTDDDVRRRIPLSASPLAAALAMPAGEIVGSFFAPDGTLEGYLLLHDGVLRLYDGNFKSLKVVFEGADSVYGFTRLPEGNYLGINGSLRIVTATGQVSAPIDDSVPLFGFADEEYIYFTSSEAFSGPWQLYRLPRGGIGPAEMMWNGEDNFYASAYGATEDAILVYGSAAGSRKRLYAVPRDAVGATSAPVLEDVVGDLSFRTLHEAPLLYTVLDRSSGATVATAKTLRYDGTVESAGPGTEWVGYQYHAVRPPEDASSLFRTQSPHSHGYLVEGIADRDTTRHQNAVLKARRLSDGADTTLATVPENALVHAFGMGAIAAGGLYDVAPEGQHDVIAADLDSGAFVRLTETDDRDEYVSVY